MIRRREWGYDIYKAIEGNCKTKYGYGEYPDVLLPNAYAADRMESFFPAETIKYLYLLFRPSPLVDFDKVAAWIVIIIIAREFIISGFRLIAADNGVVIAASYWGKFKTTFQMIMVILMIANIQALNILTQIVMWIALALTIISLIDYIVKNKNVLFDGNI